MLSRNCNGCPDRYKCGERFAQVDGRKEKFVYCPDGSRQLVDGK